MATPYMPAHIGISEFEAVHRRPDEAAGLLGWLLLTDEGHVALRRVERCAGPKTAGLARALRENLEHYRSRY